MFFDLCFLLALLWAFLLEAGEGRDGGAQERKNESRRERRKGGEKAGASKSQ